jgi:hypothetical protein
MAQTWRNIDHTRTDYETREVGHGVRLEKHTMLTSNGMHQQLEYRIATALVGRLCGDNVKARSPDNGSSKVSTE